MRYDNAPPEHRGDGGWRVKWRQGGTHTGALERPGFPTIAPTNRAVSTPEHCFYNKVQEELLIEIRPDLVPLGASHGIFEQIGVELPPL
ncbi:MAG: hypothetical protein OET44_11360 [Gammaproteobacteria bacterium]|nr:hypothetical protein [Gammaproteobacteria bacterium]